MFSPATFINKLMVKITCCQTRDWFAEFTVNEMPFQWRQHTMIKKN